CAARSTMTRGGPGSVPPDGRGSSTIGAGSTPPAPRSSSIAGYSPAVEAEVLTVDYDRLGLEAGERLLDIGCGFGRHTYEGVKRGASVVSCDLGVGELERVRAIVAVMSENNEIPDGVACMAVNGDATALPFPDSAFERV